MSFSFYSSFISLMLFNIDSWKRPLLGVPDSLEVVSIICEFYYDLMELKRIQSSKNSKLPSFSRLCLAQLSSEVCGTQGTLPPRPVVMANPIHDQYVTNVHCVSIDCCIDSRDNDTYWTDPCTFDVAQVHSLAYPKLQHFEFSISLFVLNRVFWKNVPWSS